MLTFVLTQDHSLPGGMNPVIYHNLLLAHHLSRLLKAALKCFCQKRLKTSSSCCSLFLHSCRAVKSQQRDLRM